MRRIFAPAVFAPGDFLALLRPGVTLLAFFTLTLGGGYVLVLNALVGDGISRELSATVVHDPAGHVAGSSLTAMTAGKPQYFQGGTVLEPHIALSAALGQVSTVAAARRLGVEDVRRLVERSAHNAIYNTTQGLYVDVLEVNLRLDGKLE